MSENGLKQDALADRLGATQGMVSQLLAGTTKVPSLKIATAIRDVVGIPTDAWLVGTVTALESRRRAKRRSTRRVRRAA